MTMSNVTKVYAVQDAAIAQMTADVTTAPTYGTLIDIPGIKKVGLSFDLNNKELRGDNKRLDSSTVMIGCTLTFDHAKVSFDALPILIGGTATASGSSPNSIVKMPRLSTDQMPFFFFGAKTPTGGVDLATGDLHLQLFKMKVTKYDLGLAEEDYQTFSGTAQGSFPISNDTLYQFVLHETAGAITTAL